MLAPKPQNSMSQMSTTLKVKIVACKLSIIVASNVPRKKLIDSFEIVFLLESRHTKTPTGKARARLIIKL